MCLGLGLVVAGVITYKAAQRAIALLASRNAEHLVEQVVNPSLAAASSRAKAAGAFLQGRRMASMVYGIDKIPGTAHPVPAATVFSAARSRKSSDDSRVERH